MTIAAVQTTDDPRFARAFELINKTNQFNTSGTRWSYIEARNYLADGGVWWTFDVEDRFSHHGMVGVLCIQGDRIDQFVMSCRIAGLDVELAAVPAILTAAAPDGSSFRGKIVPTDYNAVIRDLYARLGWEQDKEGWRGGARLPMPNHIRVAFDDAPDRPPIITS